MTVPLMLGSSCPEVTCKKVAVKNFAKFTGNTCAGVSFLTKLQDTCKFSKIFRDNFFSGHLQMVTSECSLFHDFSGKKTLF